MAKLAADLEGMSMMREPKPMPIIYRDMGGDLDFDYDLEEAADIAIDEGFGPSGTGEDGPSVDDFGGVDIAGPTDKQAQEAADQMETFDAGIEVARNRGIDVNQDFMQRLSNSIEGRTQNQEGENIGLTQIILMILALVLILDIMIL